MRISYAVENLRCLKEMELFELKPITVLVGENNSGKSSYLRTFPLIRRSIKSVSRIRTPIFWNDDYDIFDYGSFKSAVRNQNEQSEVTFRFRIQDLTVGNSIPTITNKPTKDSFKSVRFKDVFYEASIGYGDSGTTVNSISFKIPDWNIKADFNQFDNRYLHFGLGDFESGVNDSCLDSAHDIVLRAYRNQIFPPFEVVLDSDSKSGSGVKIMREDEIVLPRLHHLIQNAQLFSEIHKILQFPRFSEKEISNLICDSEDAGIKGLYETINSDKITIAKIDCLCKFHWLLLSLNKTAEVLHDFFRSCTYLSAERVRIRRLYPRQELVVSEIFPDGSNLAMFLADLALQGNAMVEKFSDWVEKMVGCRIHVENMPDGVSVLVDRKGVTANLADTGHGVSQILPVLAQIWMTNWNQEMEGTGSTGDFPGFNGRLRPIAIEQPETNLHPKHQAKIADAMLLAMKERESGVKPIFIIETHSESIIRRLGELVEFEGLSRGDIQIAHFSNDLKNDSSTQVSTAYFNDEGYLENWPFGFFEY